MKLRTYLRERRAAATIECALGTVAMITASLLALDLYRLANAQTTSMYAAFTLADTISRAEEGEGDALARKMTSFFHNLAGFLYKEQLPISDVTFVVSAVYKDPGKSTATVLWTEKKVFFSTEDEGQTEPECKQDEIGIETKDKPAKLPNEFTPLLSGEIVIVAEVCVQRKSTGIPGTVYAHYIVPSRYYDLADKLSS